RRRLRPRLQDKSATPVLRIPGRPGGPWTAGAACLSTGHRTSVRGGCSRLPLGTAGGPGSFTSQPACPKHVEMIAKHYRDQRLNRTRKGHAHVTAGYLPLATISPVMLHLRSHFAVATWTSTVGSGSGGVNPPAGCPGAN